MLFDFNFKSVSLLIFFIQGLIFSIFFFRKWIVNKDKSNLLLALFIFFCSLYISPFMLGYAGWYSKLPYRDIMFYIPFQHLLLLPPLLYFYIKYLLFQPTVFDRKDWWHFAPATLYLIYTLVIWIVDKIILQEYYFYQDQKDKDLVLWYQVMGFISMLYYVILSIRRYEEYKKNTLQTVSFAHAILFVWIKRFLGALLLLLLIRVLFFIFNPEWNNFGRKYWYYLSFSILCYYIAFNGYIHHIKRELLPDIFSVSPSSDEVIFTPASNGNDYDKELKEEVEALMLKEQIFKNPRLTLFDIASQLDTNPKAISSVVNKGFEMNFNDFVNSYRIKEVIRLLKTDEEKSKTLLGIALDAGFNSKSTFNRAFKKYTQLTPKEYLKKKGEKEYQIKI